MPGDRAASPPGRGAEHVGEAAVGRGTYLRRRAVVVGAFVALVVLLLSTLQSTTGRHPGASSGAKATGTAATAGSAGTNRPAVSAAGLPFVSRPGRGLVAGPSLAPGSDPAVLPSDVLIADEENNRLVVVDPTGKVVWQFPRPGDLARGQTFLSPDDAFFTPDGKDIVATEENDQVVSLISIAAHRILWRYGTPGTPGAAVNQLSNPDDAMMTPNGDVIVADIKNCSILVLRPPLHTPLERLGENTTACDHAPPLRFGSPNGAFPLTNGNYLVSEINGDWADEMTLSGKVVWSVHPPGVAYPSDTNEVAPNRFLTVDYSTPGQIVEFDSSGRLLWRYGPTSGPGMLATPSLCEPIPTSGDILCNDDGNDRVIVVDPRTNRIVWQYGHDGVAGSTPGYLGGPDGVDLAPPYSMLVRHAPTMGVPSLTCAAGLPAGACTIFAGP